MTDAVLIARGEYATIERELEDLCLDYKAECQTFEGFALSLTRNQARPDLCRQRLRVESRRLRRIGDLCEDISQRRDRMAELAALTCWFDN